MPGASILWVVGKKAGEIGIQLVDRVGVSIAGDDVDFAVVVEEHRQVVLARELVVLPGAVGRLGAEDLQARAVDVGEDVEHPVVIADARRPDAPAVDVSAFQAIGGAEVEPVDAVAGQFPVHQVPGVQDHQARVHVHRGAGEVIVLADANDVRVFKLLVEERIGVRAVAVVGGPGFGCGQTGLRFLRLCGRRRATR